MSFWCGNIIVNSSGLRGLIFFIKMAKGKNRRRRRKTGPYKFKTHAVPKTVRGTKKTKRRKKYKAKAKNYVGGIVRGSGLMGL